MNESFGDTYEVLGQSICNSVVWIFTLVMRPSPLKCSVLPGTSADAAAAGEDNTGVMHGRIK